MADHASRGNLSELSDKVPIDPLAFRRRQVEMLHGQLPLVLLANIVVGSVLFGVLYNFFPSALSLAWVTVLLITTVVRVLITLQQRKRYRESKQQSAALNSETWFLIGGSFITGIIWGSAWLLLPSDPGFTPVVLLAVFLAGMQAGAVTTTTIIMPMFLVYSIPASLLFIGYVLFALEQNQLLIAGSYLMFLFFMLPIAFRISHDLKQTIRLQIHNEALQDSLHREAAALNRKEQELAQQVQKGEVLQSEKEDATARLEDASAEKALLLESLHEGVFGLDDEGNISFTNTSAQKLLKRSNEELLGLQVTRLFEAPANGDEDNAAIKLIRECYTAGKEIDEIEACLRVAGSTTVPVTLSGVPLRKQNQVIGAVLSFLDNSRHKELEAMLQQSQKMEAIGRLTGGFAHDFNNLITVILGNIQFLKNRLTGDEQAARLLDKVSKAARSSGELNNRLLSFSREQALESDLFNISELLGEMQEFLGRLLGEDISLEINAGDHEAFLLTDRTQLQNAILSICVNARDAMPAGGRLTITTETVRLPLSHVSGESSQAEADFVEISITDNGEGIPADVQKQIFEPFFSTRDRGRGTGLGLATVYGFVRQAGGNITVNSREGEWTRFRIYLPLADSNLKPKERPLPGPTRNGPMHGTILVVEDDPNVRDVAIHSLESAGFTVVEAGNGESGLEQLRKHPETELVFSDIIMPGHLNGIEMAEAILAEHPDMPIILATGYTDKAHKDKLKDLANVMFISKPYDTETLPGLVSSLRTRKAS